LSWQIHIMTSPCSETSRRLCGSYSSRPTRCEKSPSSKTIPGGTCLNVGCIPSKAMLHIAEVMHSLDSLDDIGIELQQKPLFDMRKASRIKTKSWSVWQAAGLIDERQQYWRIRRARHCWYPANLRSVRLTAAKVRSTRTKLFSLLAQFLSCHLCLALIAKMSSIAIPAGTPCTPRKYYMRWGGVIALSWPACLKPSAARWLYRNAPYCTHANWWRGTTPVVT